MEWQNKNICKYQPIPQTSIYSSSQVPGRRACPAACTANRKISLIEQGEECISNLQVPMEKPNIHCCLKIRDWLLNAWLSSSVVLGIVGESGLPGERNLLCKLKSTGGAQLKNSEPVTFLGLVVNYLNPPFQNERGVAFTLF